MESPENKTKDTNQDPNKDVIESELDCDPGVVDLEQSSDQVENLFLKLYYGFQ